MMNDKVVQAIVKGTVGQALNQEADPVLAGAKRAAEQARRKRAKMRKAQASKSVARRRAKSKLERASRKANRCR